MKNFWLDKENPSEEDVKDLANMYCNRVMDDRHDEITKLVEQCSRENLRFHCSDCYPTYGLASSLFRACRKALKKRPDLI